MSNQSMTYKDDTLFKKRTSISKKLKRQFKNYTHKSSKATANTNPRTTGQNNKQQRENW